MKFTTTRTDILAAAMSTTIFERRIPGHGYVCVTDYGLPTSIGRYQIYKIRQLPNGRCRASFSYRHQRPAAIAAAEKWLASIQRFPSQMNSSAAE